MHRSPVFSGKKVKGSDDIISVPFDPLESKKPNYQEKTRTECTIHYRPLILRKILSYVKVLRLFGLD